MTLVEEDIIHVESMQDLDQTADVLTKLLACPKHVKHVEEMGLVSL